MQAKVKHSIVQTWRLDSNQQTLVFAAVNNALPELIYWGKLLPADENLTALYHSLIRPLSPGTLDLLGVLSILPEPARAFNGHPGIVVRPLNGPVVYTQFELERIEYEENSLVFHSRESKLDLLLTSTFSCTNDIGVIVASHQVTLAESSEEGIIIEWLSTPVIPLPAQAQKMIDFAGRWTQEFNPQRIPFRRGIHSRENRRGRTSHDHFPGLIVPLAGTNFCSGEAYGFHFGWSGGHRMLVEELADGRRQLQFGIASEPGEIILKNAGDDVSVTLYGAFSSSGLNGLAQAYQGYLRKNVVHFPAPDRPRPVHYNCWEAVYFDHDIAVLKDLAARAARLGSERFVLDDGWFGRRDDDTTSLGDWWVDTRKYPQGLQPLIEHVHQLGLSFGLWIEPEMISLDSALARTHPDWIILPNGYEPISGRQQFILDLTQARVVDYLFERIDALLSEYGINYLKWDMNRDFILALDNQAQPLCYRQTLALYELIDRIRHFHPNVEIESCASGGGRIDYAILQRTDRIWLSDSNDAHERWLMQNNAFMFLPLEIIGSHVGPRHCHTSGRQLSMSFRAAVAMTGHMGFEMDLRELTAEEENTLKAATAFYKQERDFLHSGLQYRLDTSHSEIVAQMIVDSFKSRFLLFSATMAVSRNETTAPLRLAGLATTKTYRLRLLNPQDIAKSATRKFASPLLTAEGLSLSGAALMQSGVVLPQAHPDTMWIVEGIAL